MAKVDRFEDLECWIRARQLSNMAFGLCKKSSKLYRDFGTNDQLKRAALSSMNNIAEGFGRHSPKEFIRFLDIAQSSCVEVKSMSYLLEDQSYISEEESETLRNRAEDTRRLVLGLMRYLRKVASETT